jgi:hypothetical protein
MLVVEHRLVWGTLGEVPAEAPMVRDGCPSCGGDAEPELTSRMVAQTAPPVSLAGVMPKLAARDHTWLVCRGCGYDAPAHVWAWVRCTAEGCTRESRGRLE